MTEVKWIKVVVDIFDDEKILLIESLPDSDSIIVCWFKLLCLAGKQNNSGVLMLNDRIPYTDEMLATIFRRPLQTVRLALETFERFGMIEIVNGAVTIPNWGKHQQLEKSEKIREQTRERVSRYRERQRLLSESNVTGNADVTQSNATELEQEYKNKNKNKNTEDFERVAEAWNALGLAKVSKIASGTERYNLLNRRIKDYGIDKVLEAIENVRKSSFLMGGGKNGWTATFDWFVKPNNFPKVLDGNYNDQKEQKKPDDRMVNYAPDMERVLAAVDRI